MRLRPRPEGGTIRLRTRIGLKRLALVVVKFALVSAAFVAVLLGSGYFAMRTALLGRQITVPDVTGMEVAAAQEALQRRELFIEAASERHDDRVEKGRILAQDPPAGASLKKYRKVKVVTSLGPKVFKVPDVRGMSLRSAQIKLQDEGLRTGSLAYAHTLVADADVVVSQDPLPTGESLGEAGVSFLVSKGAREPVYVMPDLTGRRPDEARRALEARGIRVGGVRRERRTWTESGTVSRQYPEAGHPVSRGQIVSLVVGD
jgi:serine/threonine-protein kinase